MEYYFYIPEQISNTNAVYLVPNNFNNYDMDIFKEINFEKYKILISKNKN